MDIVQIIDVEGQSIVGPVVYWRGVSWEPLFTNVEYCGSLYLILLTTFHYCVNEMYRPTLIMRYDSNRQSLYVYYEGRPINKLQNCIILLIFKI